jgi:hypothetical protein
MITIIISSLALAIAPQPVAHSVTVDHQSAPVKATYRADVEVSTRQIGMSAGARPSTARCTWQARVGVVRDIAREDGTPISRRLDEDRRFEGSRPGSCMAATAQIERDLGSHQEAVRAHVKQVAERDEQNLRAELRALTELAQN